MRSEPDVTEMVRAWLRADAPESADHVLKDVLALVDHNSQHRSWGQTRRLQAVAALAVAAAAVVVVGIAGTFVLSRSDGGVGGLPAAASPSALPEPSADGRVVGLPPVGATPSGPVPGELVLRFEGNVTPGRTMWVYRDGRLLLARPFHAPSKADPAYIGLTEQRLTPGGVEFLRSSAVASGLFERDLTLAREGNAPYLDAQVRSGDRLVRVTWAQRGIVGPNASLATPEQESALRALDALLINRSSWPPSVWEDQEERSYVPSEYSICFGVRAREVPDGNWTAPIEQARVLAVLPAAAQDLLRTVDSAAGSGMHANAGCSRVTTDDAHAIVRILGDAGIEPVTPRRGEYWLGFEVEDPRLPEYSIWIQFGPVLPHGVATWIGPG